MGANQSCLLIWKADEDVEARNPLGVLGTCLSPDLCFIFIDSVLVCLFVLLSLGLPLVSLIVSSSRLVGYDSRCSQLSSIYFIWSWRYGTCGFLLEFLLSNARQERLSGGGANRDVVSTCCWLVFLQSTGK